MCLTLTALIVRVKQSKMHQPFWAMFEGTFLKQMKNDDFHKNFHKVLFLSRFPS